jgi:DHA2 family multidrug resistance protein
MGVPILLAPALGPTIGGYIVTYANWQLIFYLNVPIGIIGFIMASVFLQESPSQGRQYFDYPGFLFSSVGMASVLYALDSAGTDGWGSAKVLTFLIIGVGSLMIFVLVELLTISNGKPPLLDIRLFGTLSFTGANIANIMGMFSLYGGLYILPIYLQNLRGQTAYEAGVILLPQAFASMLTSIVGGILVDKVGTKWVVIPGLIILSLVLWSLSGMTLETPFATLQIFLIIRGLTTGLATQPLNNASLADLKPRQVSQGSTITSVLRSVASAFSVAIMTTIISTQTKVHYTHLAEQVTANSPSGNFVQQLAGYFMTQGYNAQNAMTAALTEIYGVLQQQSYMLSIKDAFFLSMVITIISIFVVLIFIRSPRKQKSDTLKGNKAEASTEAEEEEESLEPVFMH